jgi:hypothetical protein
LVACFLVSLMESPVCKLGRNSLPLLFSLPSRGTLQADIQAALAKLSSSSTR